MWCLCVCMSAKILNITFTTIKSLKKPGKQGDRKMRDFPPKCGKVENC